MAIGAGLVAGTSLLLPQRLAHLHVQHGGVGGVVILHLLQSRAHVLIARPALVLATLRHCERRQEYRSQSDRGRQPHVTVTITDPSAKKFRSPVHWKRMVPLSFATAKKET